MSRLLALYLVLLLASPAQAYVGPGAGFALVTSFLVVFAAVGLALFYLATWPLRLLWALLSGRRAYRKARVKRLVVLGLDGLDAGFCRRLLGEGKLPNLAGLHFRPLATTTPAMSPVAWSTFATGLDPSYHGIFDFLRPARPSYRAELSSVLIAPPRRALRLGRLRIPLGRPVLRSRRRGEPFWNLLGRKGVFSAVLRVPITFPPESAGGVLLSAMCVPDLRGTQGTFTHFSTNGAAQEDAASLPGPEEGGVNAPLRMENGVARGELTGPPDPLAAGGPGLRIPFSVEPALDGSAALLRIGRERVPLEPGRHTGWVRVAFRARLGVRIRGLVRFCLIETGPRLRLYASPVQLDPEKPALPISRPASYSVYLARRHGPFATLGLAEDTWALNERVLDEAQFLDGTWRIHAEREAMFFDALASVRRGLVACVFDASDRIQHMFMGLLHPDHPASRLRDPKAHAGVLEGLYRRMDELVGRTRAALGAGDALVVLSDHGFTSFLRGVNLNAWLLERGYLVLKQGAAPEGDWFAGVDWSKSRAYALGLAGIYLNRKGREGQGILGPTEAAAVAEELRAGLLALRDPEAPEAAVVRRVFFPEQVFRGPYREEAPDLLVGFGEGYRISWGGAVGSLAGPVFSDNLKSWSGDHCVDPALVPGVLFSTLPIGAEEPALLDLAPSLLDLFGVDAPERMRGRKLFAEARA